MLLLPIGFGHSSQHTGVVAVGPHGFLTILYEAGIITKRSRPYFHRDRSHGHSVIFEQPSMLFFGAAARLGIFLTMALAVLLKFPLKSGRHRHHRHR